MQHPEPQQIDGVLLSQSARLNLRRLVHLVGRAHRDAPDPSALGAAEVVLGAFKKTHELRFGVWQPKRTFRVGAAIVRSREHVELSAAQVQVVAAATGQPCAGLTRSLLEHNE